MPPGQPTSGAALLLTRAAWSPATCSGRSALLSAGSDGLSPTGVSLASSSHHALLCAYGCTAAEVSSGPGQGRGFVEAEGPLSPGRAQLEQEQAREGWALCSAPYCPA